MPSLTRDVALLLFAHEDGRVFFVLPWASRSLVGTTDTDDDAATRRVVPAAEDVALPVGGDRAALARPRRVGVDDCACSPACGRSRARAPRPPVGQLARGAAPGRRRGMFSLVGGKYTTARLLAERAVDAVVRRPRPPNGARA